MNQPPSLPYTTCPFAMPRGRFITRLFMLYGKPYMIILGAAAAAAVLLAVFWRYEAILAAAMILLVALPGMAANLYYIYGLRPENAINVLQHTLTFSAGKITAEISLHKKTDETAAPQEDSTPQEKTVTYALELFSSPTLINDTDGSLLLLPKGTLLHYGNKTANAKGFLYIPYSAIAENFNLSALSTR